MVKVNLEQGLYERARKVAESAGYSSFDEFIARAVETELQRSEVEAAEEQVADQLRGLGYIE